MSLLMLLMKSKCGKTLTWMLLIDKLSGPTKLDSLNLGLSSILSLSWTTKTSLSKTFSNILQSWKVTILRLFWSCLMTAGTQHINLESSLILFQGFITRNGFNVLEMSNFQTQLIKTTLWQFSKLLLKVKTLHFGIYTIKLEILNIMQQAFLYLKKFSHGLVQPIHLNH